MVFYPHVSPQIQNDSPTGPPVEPHSTTALETPRAERLQSSWYSARHSSAEKLKPMSRARPMSSRCCKKPSRSRSNILTRAEMIYLYTRMCVFVYILCIYTTVLYFILYIIYSILYNIQIVHACMYVRSACMIIVIITMTMTMNIIHYNT